MQKVTEEFPHSVWQGSFVLFGVTLQCHVLDDGQRIIEQASVDALFDALDKSNCEDLENIAAVHEFHKFHQWLRDKS